uniref:EF-hand domain-containing protein n=1 Tax=Macrostomum lignano TaxID=282301 RepID=A0A1I8FJM7_9PLAT
AVGKTSLVLALVSEEFPNIVPPKAEEITIPADITPERVPTQIVDFSSEFWPFFCDASRPRTSLSEIRQANVRLQPLAALESIARRTSRSLVGNKSDASERSSCQLVLKVMNSYPEVETCIEHSGSPEGGTVYPTFQLYRPDDKELTVQCRTALTRIFRICDLDNDGYMNDRELELFPTALLPGFLQLCTRCCSCRRARHETTWRLLRRFGLTTICDCAFRAPPLRVSLGVCSAELSYSALVLSTLFDGHDCDGRLLSPLEAVFVRLLPLNSSVHAVLTIETIWLGWFRSGFPKPVGAAKPTWSPSRALELLVCLGYTYEFENPLSAVQVTRERRLDLDKRQTSRTWTTAGGAAQPGRAARMRDAAALLYDITDPDSFQFIAHLYLKPAAANKIPAVLVGTKSDQHETPQYISAKR